MMDQLVVGEHVIKGFSKLIRNLLDLQLFSVNLILNIVNLLIQLGDVHLSILKSSLCSFKLQLNCVDLVLQFFFPLNSLLSRFLQRFHVLTNRLEFFLNTLHLLLSNVSPLKRALERADTAEKAVEREEKLKDKIHTIQLKFKAAEGRFEYGE